MDLGMLAHAAALAAPGRHKQMAEQTSIPEGSLVSASFRPTCCLEAPDSSDCPCHLS